MSHLMRALPDMARTSVAGLVAYRAEMTIWILTATLPLVMLAMWDAVASSGPVAGFDRADIARYFAATLVVRQLSSVWLVWALNYEIRTGRLSTRLLRPLHPFWVFAVDMLAALPIRLVVLLPLLAAVIAWRPELWQTPSLAAMGLFAVSMSLAWLQSFLVQALFGIFAFWVDKSEGLFGVWTACWMLLSGYIAPLAVFPEWAHPWLACLPFRGMLAVPVELLGGFLAPADAAFDLAVQVGWTAVFGAAVAVLWRRGLQRYGAFGA